MSKALFEFVKVAAGEPSNLPENVYTVFRQPDIHTPSACLLLDGKIISYEEDKFILRPAESPDAGREGFIQKVMDEVEGPHPYPRRSEICSMFENAMRLHFPTPNEDLPRTFTCTKCLNQYVKHPSIPTTICGSCKMDNYILDSESLIPTPADPDSQVEAVDPAKLLEWVRKNGFFPDIDNEWTKYNHGTRSYEVFKDADLITLYKQSL